MTEQLHPGARVLLVCSHGHMRGKATVLRCLPAPCDCGAALYRVRVDESEELPAGVVADMCAEILHRPN
jgi:hypothetical protein